MTSEPHSPNPKGNGRRKGPWSQREIEKLKLKFGLVPLQRLSQELNRSVDSIRRMVHRVFDGPPRTGPWTAEEVLRLKEYIGAAQTEDIARIFRRTPQEIRRKVEELESRIRPSAWTSEDIQQFKRLYGNRSDTDLAVIFAHPVEEIQALARELCLAKDKAFLKRTGQERTTRMPRWTPEEIQELRRLYPTHSNLEIAQALGRTQKSVVSKAHDLGLRKSPERLRRMGEENVRRRYRGRRGRTGQEEAEAGA
ncbi:MAG: hypothetical protein D6702_04740 [Planctomycetota bacterium]|nr:MAG: hypothetical protein D6702_04740 [Planctomycetota bacterium]